MGRLSIGETSVELVESDRERAVAQRDTLELLRSRVGLLTGTDRALVMMYLEQGNSFHRLAGLAGLQASTVARRIRRIIERLHDDTYGLCLKQQDCFDELELAIVKDHFILGLSAMRISRNRNISYYRTRAALRKARRLAEKSRGIQNDHR